MFKIISVLLVVLLSLAPALAQTIFADPAFINWEQAAASLAEANSFGVNLYVDASPAAVTLTGKTCTGATSPYACKALLPVLAAGVHTFALTVTLGGFETVKSPNLSATKLAAPANLRVTP